MKSEITDIAGLTCEKIGGKRIVKFDGIECALIKRREILCEQDTSFRGCVLDSWETYQTPVGIVERHYWARGAGLERSGVTWHLVPSDEIKAAQERFLLASRELASAKKALVMLVESLPVS